MKAISILLLMAYMAILCHNMVPHTHHNECRVTLSVLHNHYQVHRLQPASHYHPQAHHHHHSHHHHHYHYHDHLHDHSHYCDFHNSYHRGHNSKYYHSYPEHFAGVIPHAHNYISGPVTDEGKGHSQGFPLHHHGSPTNDYDYLRLKIQFVFSSNDQQPLLLYQCRESENSLVLPSLFSIRWYDYPFLIRFQFEPGATGLRGPPSIA